MPRKHERKTDRTFDGVAMKRAVNLVLEKGESLRFAANKFGVKTSTLLNYVNKTKNSSDPGSMSFTPNFKTTQVFSDKLEKLLEEYLLKCSDILFGLTPVKLRQLAYAFGLKNGCKLPKNWHDKHRASADWFTGFMNRHPHLSLRAPEPTSLSRMTSFNKYNVDIFFDKLKEVIDRNGFQSHQIYNLDESGVTTVLKVPKVIAKKGQKQVGLKTSAERGELITQVGIICAGGNALPPIWIFPRVRFDPKRMMAGVQDQGALGLVHPSGWMTNENFLKVLHHLAKHSNCSRDNKILLIVDNHKTHLSVEALDFCKERGIVMLTFPPHTTGKLQPLDTCVFGPFKTFLSHGIDSWMTNNPGQPISIYDLPAICCSAWDKAATPANVKSGFRSTGIFPYDRDIFKEEDFLCSSVTDRPPPPVVVHDATESTPAKAATQSDELSLNSQADMLSPSGSLPLPEDIPAGCSNFTHMIVSPEEILPLPKAAERKSKGRKRGRCMIATDTPEKVEIEAAALRAKTMKTAPKQVKKKLFSVGPSSRPKKEKAPKIKTPQAIEISSESDTESVLTNVGESSGGELDLESDSDIEYDIKDLQIGSYVIVKVNGKTATSYRRYVAQIKEPVWGGYVVQFLKRLSQSFRFTHQDETCFAPFEDIVQPLPQPQEDTRERFKNTIFFNIDLVEFSLF